ncbi:T9SS type A sorting domain-containing protein [Chitinophagaceae bacterium MMS25-I14]
MKKLLSVASVLIISIAAQAQYFKTVSSGTEFTFALRSDSTLWSWGYNGNGQLGINGATTVTQPQPADIGHKWIAVAAGGFHHIAIAADSTLWGSGNNGANQLGLDTAANTVDTVTQISNQHWRSISAGYANSAAIRNDGTLWVAGYNAYGTLGVGDTATRDHFVQVGTDNNWKAVSVGGLHMLALKNNGTLWSWGNNAAGELCTGSTANHYTPVQVGADTNWAAISADFELSLALKSNGTIWSCGLNNTSQLGRATSGSSDSVLTQIGTDTNWKTINAASVFGFAIKQNGTLWGWGFNSYGNLGMSAASAVYAPTMIGNDNNWVYISGATGSNLGGSLYGTHAAGLKTGGQGICTTGSNYVGQLGNGSVSSVNNYQDYFGCGILPAPTAVNTVQTVQPVHIYPNPTQGDLNISLPETMYGKSLTLNIKDLAGKTVLQNEFTGSNATTVRTEALVPGIYFMQIGDNNGFQYNTRFVKQ